MKNWLAVKAYPLVDGIFSVDSSKRFVPFDPAKDDFASLPSGGQVLSVTPFVVVTSSDIILLDGGLGIKDDSGQPILLRNLAQLGYNPEDISMVVLSHLHKDHIAGLGALADNGSFQFYFPNAQLFFQKKEMDFALSSDTPSFNKKLLLGLANLRNVKLLDGDGQITEDISYLITGGHTPYHQAISMEDADRKIFFGADVAPLLFQMKHNIVGKYDYDGRRAANWRRKWWIEAQEEHWEFLFYHDYKHPIISL
ncbi:MAG: MBL fold metallo-hydrolase [Chitinophagaceae bacterium]